MFDVIFSRREYFWLLTAAAQQQQPYLHDNNIFCGEPFTGTSLHIVAGGGVCGISFTKGMIHMV